MDWLPLTLLSAFSFASADAATKRFLSDYTPAELALVRFAWTGALLAPLLLAQPFPVIPAPFWAWVGALLPLEILAMVLYMRAIRASPLAATLPYLAFTPVFTTVTGWIILGEQVSPIGFGGIVLVTAGAYFLNLEPAAGRGWRIVLVPWQAMARAEGPRIMIVVAALYSVTSVLGKGALGYVPPAFFGPFYMGLLGLATVLGCGLGRPAALGALWRRPAAAFTVGIAMAMMMLTHFLAVQRVEVAYMIAAKRTSLLFGILYGALLFREPRLARNLSAGALMVLGVALIAA